MAARTLRLAVFALLQACFAQNYDLGGKQVNILTVDSFKCSSDETLPRCYVVTSAPSKSDAEMIHNFEEIQLTRLLGILPASHEDIGTFFGQMVLSMQRSGPVKLCVLEHIDAETAKKIRKQFPNMFKATRSQLPFDGKGHDEVSAKLEDIAAALEKQGKGYEQSPSFFNEAMYTYRAEATAAAEAKKKAAKAGEL
jgi:hypothetical protein